MATRGSRTIDRDPTQGRRCFETSLDIKVGTYEIDYAGHVSNQVYLRWCEDLRLQLLEEHFPLEELMADGFMPVIIESNVRYHKPIKLFDKPTGYMWLDTLGPAKMEFCGEFKIGDVLATSVKHTGVFVNTKTMKPMRMPERIVSKYKEWQRNNE